MALARIQRLLEGLQHQRRNEFEYGPAILKRLVSLERLVRGDPGLATVPKHAPRRPLGTA